MFSSAVETRTPERKCTRRFQVAIARFTGLSSTGTTLPKRPALRRSTERSPGAGSRSGYRLITRQNAALRVCLDRKGRFLSPSMLPPVRQDKRWVVVIFFFARDGKNGHTSGSFGSRYSVSGRCARPVTKSDDFRVGLESLVWWIWKQFSFLVKVRRCVLRKRAPRGGFHFYLPPFASLRKIEK